MIVIRHTGWIPVLLIMLILSGCSHTRVTLTAVPVLSPSRCSEPPAIDGELTDACWESSEPLGAFDSLQTRESVGNVLTVKTLYDKAWLYFAFSIRVPRSRWMRPSVIDHDGGVTADDSIEILVGNGRANGPYHHYMLNCANVRAESRCAAGSGPACEPGWSVPWRSATKRTRSGWQAEIALPLSVLTDDGDLSGLRLNIGVNRILHTINYINMVAHVRRETLTWSPVLESLREPERFGVVTGLDSITSQTTFLAAIRDAGISDYCVDESGAVYYSVSGVVESFTGMSGELALVVVDQPCSGKGKTVAAEISVAGKGPKPFSIDVPVAAANARNAVLILRDEKRSETLQSVFLHRLAEAPLLRCFVRNSYYTIEKNAEIVCETALPEAERKQLKLAVKTDNGRILTTVAVVGKTTVLPVALEGFANGEHKLSVELFRKDGKVVVGREVVLVRRRPKPGCEWKIDHLNRTILNNGKPFFPFGVMAISRDGGDMQKAEFVARDLAAMGFNTVIRWTRLKFDNFDSLVQLPDLGRKYGFYVVDFPLYSWQYNAAKDELAENKITGKDKEEWLWDHVFRPGITRIMNHPNLMAYYLFDEAGSSLRRAALIERLNRNVRTLDPYHPTEVLYGRGIPPGDIYSRNCDILGVDPYWTPNGGTGDYTTPNRVGRLTRWTRLRADRDVRLAWLTPCAENWSGIRKRFIDREEQRVQTYLSLIHGASGLIYFVYPFKLQQTFETFRELGAEMKILGPACASGPVAQIVRYNPVPFDPYNNLFPDVQVSLKRNPAGGYILLAANHRAWPVDATFELSLVGMADKVKTLFHNNRDLRLRDGMFSDTFAPMDTRAYAVDVPTEPGAPVEISVRLISHPRKADNYYVEPAVGDHGVPGRKNLLRNASFEANSLPGAPDYFRDIRTDKTQIGYRLGDTRGDCGWNLDPKNPYHGKVSLRLSGEHYTFLLIETVPKVTKPTKFVFSAYVRGDGTGGLGVRCYGKVDERRTFDLTTKWRRIHAVYTIEPDMKTADGCFLVGVYPVGGKGERSIWIDAVQFEEGTEPRAFELLEK